MANTQNDDIMDEYIGEPVTEVKKFEKKEADPTREGQILDVMNAHNLGTILVRLIPDTIKLQGPDGKPRTRLYRKINNAFTVKVKGPEDKFPITYQIPSDMDFVVAGGLKLTSSQAQLLKNTRDTANNISKFLTYENRKRFGPISEIIPVCQYHRQIVLFYGKLIKFLDKSGAVSHAEELDKVRVFKFAKGKVGVDDFITKFQKALSLESNLSGGSPAWKRQYFERKTGKMDSALSIMVDRANDTFGTYSLDISFREKLKSFEITDHDLEIAENLNNRAFDITQFDEKMLNDCLSKLNYVQQQINNLGNQSQAAPVEDAVVVEAEDDYSGFEESPF